MSDVDRPLDAGLLDDAGVPPALDREYLDVRELPPPEPLTETLERLVDLPEDAVLVQANDRVPQHLFPKLDDRGYAYEHTETDDGTVYTAIWPSN